MTLTVLPLENPIQNYAWGSKTAIAAFLGRANEEGKAEAELWIGAHPKAPSRVDDQGSSRSLADLIRSAPEATLGPGVAREYAGELPFLLKVIAAAEPLSIQCHPNREQARAGFARESRLGLPLDAFERNYRDPNHKPELLVALTRFLALKGFRPVADLLRLVAPLGLEALQAPLEALERTRSEEALRRLFSTLLALGVDDRARLVERATAGAAKRRGEDPAYPWVLRLAEKHPGDVGVLAPLLLNLVELEPEQGLYLPAGELHTYLEGTALEIMANSDNVLRGGLTSKHVDVKELLATASFRPAPPEVLRPKPRRSGERVYRSPAREFELSLVRASPGRPFEPPPGRGVELLLGLDGHASLSVDGRSFSLARGRSLFVPAAAGGYLIEGEGRICRAGVPA